MIKEKFIVVRRYDELPTSDDEFYDDVESAIERAKGLAELVDDSDDEVFVCKLTPLTKFGLEINVVERDV